MIRKSLLLALLSVLTTALSAQAFVGMNRPKVISEMNGFKDDFVLDETVRNDKYDYLKYLSDDGLETWIIVFGSDDKCKAVRVTCSNGLLLKKRKELDNMYTKEGSDRWSYNNRDGFVFVILENQTWYFTITYSTVAKL